MDGPNRFVYLLSGSVMVPMTVWMVQMKYFVKIKEGVKSKYCKNSNKSIFLSLGRLSRQGNINHFILNTLFRTPLLFMNNPEKCFPEKFFMCDIGLCITKGTSMLKITSHLQSDYR